MEAGFSTLIAQYGTERKHEKTAYLAHRAIYSGQRRKDRISSRLEQSSAAFMDLCV